MTDTPNNDGDQGRATERTLVIGYCPAGSRHAFAALLALDDRLGDILRTTREPLVGQMRLTWWHEALCALDTRPAPAEPILQTLSAHVCAHVSGATLAGMVEGWEVLLEAPLDRGALEAHAQRRGGGLFEAAARIVDGGAIPAAQAGTGWAFADLSRHLSDAALADWARGEARRCLAESLRARWPAPLRGLGALAHSARLDVVAAPRPAGHPARAARLLWHRATGR